MQQLVMLLDVLYYIKSFVEILQPDVIGSLVDFVSCLFKEHPKAGPVLCGKQGVPHQVT